MLGDEHKVFEPQTPVAVPRNEASSTEVTFKERHTVVLHTVQAVQWSRMMSLLLSIPTDFKWQMFIIVMSIINFFAGTFFFFFARDRMDIFIPVFLLCDVMYAIHVCLGLANWFWVHGEEKPSMFFLTIDVVTLLLQETFVGKVFGPQSRLTLSIRWFTYLRLRHLNIFPEMYAGVLRKRLRLFMIGFVLCFFVIYHFATCIMYELSCHHLRCPKFNESMWYHGRWSKGMIDTYPSYRDAGVKDWYLLSCYVVLENLLTAGTGIVKTRSTLEMAMLSAIMIMGYIFFKLFFLTLLFRIGMYSGRLRTDYINKVQSIYMYLREVTVDKSVLNNIERYIDILWWKKDGLKKAPHFETLPNPLRTEIMYDVNGTHLHRSLLFFDLREFYLRTLSLSMKHEFLLPGDILFHQGVIKPCMVIIIRGVLEIMSEEDDETPIIAFRAGTVLGEASLFFNLPSKATVRAAVYTEVKLIERYTFLKDISIYLLAFYHLKERINRRVRNVESNKLTNEADAFIWQRGFPKKQLTPLSEFKQRLEEQRKKQAEKAKQFDANVFQEVVRNQEDIITLYQLSAEDSNTEIPVICLTWDFPWILDSKCSLVTCWEVLVILVHTIFCICYSYEVVYIKDLSETVYNMCFVSDVICFCDIIMQTCTSVVLKEKTLKTFRDIVRYRMRSLDFYLNVIPVFPFEYFTVMLYKVNHQNYGRTFDLLMGVRLLRMHRSIKLINKLRYPYCEKHTVYQIISTAAYFFVITYFVGCILYLTSCMYNLCLKYSWFYAMMQKSLEERDPRPKYTTPFLSSMYFAAQMWMHLGIGDIQIMLPWDFPVAVTIIVLGSLVWIYLISSLAASIATSSLSSETFLVELLTFESSLKHYNVPMELQGKMMKYFELQWDYDRGLGRNEFSKLLPIHLRIAVFKRELLDLLNLVPLFQQTDVDFMMHIVLSCTIKVLPPGYIVENADDVEREMFLIQKGNCAVYDSDGTLVQILSAGQYYGDIEMIFSVSKWYTVVTLTNTKIVRITYTKFKSALSAYPGELKIIQKVTDNEEIRRDLEVIEQKRLLDRVDRKEIKEEIKKMREDTLRGSFIYLGNIYKKSDGEESYWEPFRQMNKRQIVGILLLPVTIHPESVFLKGWLILRAILLVAHAFCLPLAIGLPPAGRPFRIILVATEYSAYIELYMFLHLAYYNSEGLLISHPKFTAMNYFRHGFLLDLIAAFPFYAIRQIEVADRLDPLVAHLIPFHWRSLWRAMSLIQLHRIFGFINYLQNDIMSKSNKFRFVVILLSSLIFLYVCTVFSLTDCGYHFFPHEMDKYQNYSTITVYDPETSITYYGYLICGESSWIVKAGYQGAGAFKIVILAFYAFLNVFTQVCLGDVVPNEESFMLYSITVAILGMCLSAYIIAFINNESGVHSASFVEYQRKILELMTFFRREQLCQEKVDKVFHYFEYVWNRTSGMESKVMIRKLNSALEGDICLFLYEKTLREMRFFENIPVQYLRVIAKKTREEYFLRGDTIIKSYDVHDSIYIVMRGKVNVLTPYGFSVTTIKTGGCFGNIHQAKPGCASATFTAMRNVDVLKISSRTFYRIAQEYPIVERALEQMRKQTSDFLLPTVEVSDDVVIPEQSISIISLQSPLPDTCLMIFIKFFLNPFRWFRFALEPDHSIFDFTWKLTFAVTCYQMFAIPYFFVSQNFHPLIFYPSFMFEPIFYIRIFFFFHEAYLDEYGSYVKDCRLIMKHYFTSGKKWFWDLVPNIPICLFYLAVDKENSMFIFSLLRLFQLLRWRYIFEAFSLWSAPILARKALLLILEEFLVFILLLHYLALLAFSLFGRFGDFSDSSRELLRHANPLDAYVVCFYYVASIITGTGVGDIAPKGNTELFFTICMIISTKIIFAGLIGSIIVALRISIQQIIRYEGKVVTLDKYLENQGLSDHIMKKLWVYIKQLWCLQGGLHMPELLKKSPYVMRCDVMTELYSKHLDEGYLFKDINRALLNQICGRLKRRVFFQGNYIVQHGDTDASMYWIHNGKVSVLTVHPNLTETRHETLGVHDTFGLLSGLNHEMPHTYSYRAETMCEILVLKLETWENLLDHFPNDKEVIYRRMLNAYKIL